MLPHDDARLARSVSDVRRLRSDESWVEVASHASSSSVSSLPQQNNMEEPAQTNMEEVARRRRRLQRAANSEPAQTQTLLHQPSSPEADEESESESDRVLTSSNEHVDRAVAGASSAAPSSASEEASSNNAESIDDEDENATALGVGSNDRVFTPPANAFSHPPQLSQSRHVRSLEARESYFASRPLSHRRLSANSVPSRNTRQNHTPYNIISTTHRVDHDAALRASLTTLLSCAAAARGLPKHDTQGGSNTHARGGADRIQPSTLRLVPESELLDNSHNLPDLPPRPHQSTSSNSLSESTSSLDNQYNKQIENRKRKRRSSPTSRQHRKPSPSSSQEELEYSIPAPFMNVHPTYITWALSAGAIVFFSALTFSAGYILGRSSVVMTGGSSGPVVSPAAVPGNGESREVYRGLRRLRWPGGMESGIGLMI